jgi:hypothetical protein
MNRDPDAVLQGVRRALKPGGGFAGEVGGHGCAAAIAVALCATLERYGVANPASRIPWYFPTPEEYGERLRAEFQVECIALIPPNRAHGNRGWLETFAIPFTKSVPEDNGQHFSMKLPRDCARCCATRKAGGLRTT